MPERITAEKFWEKFATCFGQRIELTSEWPALYESDTRWTSFVKEGLRSTCTALGFKDSGTCTFEDFRVDVCCFSLPRLDQGEHDAAWNLEVAIEHENNSRTWLQEWVKLAHLSCGLRVVISYEKQVQSISPESAMLKRAASLAQTRSYTTGADNWLLLLGPTSDERGPGDDFVAFSFDGKEFHQLPDRPVL